MSDTVTAIVVSYHTGPRLKECLYALVADAEVSQIVIVDNGNTPQAQAELDAFTARYSQVELIRDGTNPGFGASINKGAERASGDYLLIINPDAVLRRGSVKALIAAGQGKPIPCIIGGRIFGVDGREQRGGRRHKLTLWRVLGFQSWNMHKEPLPEAPIQVGAISGAFFLVSRSDFNKLHGFDETYFLHFEDLDICARAIKSGGSVWFQPKAGALHYTSTSDVASSVVTAYKADSLKYYLKTHADGFLERLVAALLSSLIHPLLKRRN